IRVARIGGTLCRKPCNDAGNLLIGHRAPNRPGYIRAPVRHAEVWPAGDDRASQALIADKGEIRRIDDRAGARRVATATKLSKHFLTAILNLICIRLSTRRVWRRSGQNTWMSPRLKDSMNQAIDLRIGERTPRRSGETRHQLPANSVRRNLPDCSLAGKRKINGIR